MVIPQLILGLSLKFQVTCRLGELPLCFLITLCTEQQKWWSALLLYCYSGMDAYVLSFHSSQSAFPLFCKSIVSQI